MTLSQRVLKAVEIDSLDFYDGDTPWDGVRAERERLKPLIEGLMQALRIYDAYHAFHAPPKEHRAKDDLAYSKLRAALDEMEKR